MVVVFVLVVLVVLGLLAGVHWYLWRRLVRDTTAPGSRVRRLGTAAAVVLPLTTLGALIGGRAGAPFAVERALAWPGYVWLALVLYLTLALLVGEAVRPLLRAWLTARGSAAALPADVAAPTGQGDAGARAVTPVGEPTPGEPSALGAAPTRGTAPGSRTDTPAIATARESAVAAAEATATVVDETAATQGPAASSSGTDTESPAAVSRRLFVARTVAVAASTVASGTVAYGAYDVLTGPSLQQITVPLAKLPRRAHGYRIAVVSDIHLGPILGGSHTQRIVELINGTQPDLVAIVGDLVDGSVADLGTAAEPLARLRSRHGAYFVTGNHEYFSGAEEWVERVHELGVRPLENARVELPGFDLAGVNDVSAHGQGPAGAAPDFARALGDRDRTRASVLLAHQPVVIHDAVRYGVDLQLSGHTHGGQLWPGNYLAALANPTVAGLERYGDTQLYVTRGAGAWGPPVRVGAPPDITVVTLASRQA